MTITPSTQTELPNNVGTMVEVVEYYSAALSSLQTALDQALADVEANPSDPGALAEFQAASSDFTTFKTFVSTVVKSFTAVNTTILRNV